MGQKWLQREMLSQGYHLKKPNLGNQGQINITVKMHLVIRPV